MTTALLPRLWFRSAPPSIFHELDALTRDFDALFGGGSSDAGRTWQPAVHTRTKDGGLVVRYDLPGVDPKEVEVSLDRDQLTIRGERRTEQEDQGYREVHYGRFERTLQVPEGIDPEKVSARYDKGVLEVTLPAPASTARKVPVSIEVQSPKAA
jgi:HSP20 family protein